MSAEIDEYPSLRCQDIRIKKQSVTDGPENSISHHKQILHRGEGWIMKDDFYFTSSKIMYT